MNDIEKDDFILDESHLDKIQNDEDIDKFITTPLIEDNHFFNKKLKDEISGNDYKEVVNQAPRHWLIKKENEKKNKIGQKLNNMNDALRTFEEENKKRGLNPFSFMPQLRNIKGKKNKGDKNGKSKTKISLGKNCIKRKNLKK